MAIALLCFFATATPASSDAVDYSQPENWAYLAVGDPAMKSADLFLLAPTVWLGFGGEYNMSIADGQIKKYFLAALNMERGIYEGECRMFAPYYRQVALSVFEMEPSEAEQYFDEAYGDVKAAFLQYMSEFNGGRPLVLAGFSQGAKMAMRLMEEQFDGKQPRLVAAYLIGWRVTSDDIDGRPWLKMAERADDTGVIISFNTEAVDVDSSLSVPRGVHSLSINPLNWSAAAGVDKKADRSLNLGACFTDAAGAITKEVPHLTGAYIDPVRGTLKVTDIRPEEYPPILAVPIFGLGVYHLYDYQFFYRNLQQNVADRVAAFLK
jgi:hypothetical protein